jgi:activator of HSP90 ATPase
MKNEFTLSVVLNVKPEALCKAWLDSEEHAKFTGSPAEIVPKVGGKFTAWDGYISGKTLELDPGKRILQNWRTTDFDNKSPDSKIEITFEKADKGTKLTLRHFNIPEGTAEEYKKGWKDFYFEPMKKYYPK